MSSQENVDTKESNMSEAELETTVVETEEVESTEKAIVDYFTAETYSPYGMMKVVNEILRDAGVSKVLPGPMFYTYCKKGYITTVEGSNAKTVKASDAALWTEEYLIKLVKKATVKNTVVVEDEYVGFENEA